MSTIVSVNVDEPRIMEICKEKIAEMLKEADSELVFWDTSELKKRTCMSWNFIQNTFFFDQRFVKRKIGGKWYFPAKEARDFLEIWLREQKND